MSESSRHSVSHEPRAVLIKSVNWLGDVVMTLPAMRAVRASYPRARLAVLIKQELESFFDGSRWVDEVIPYRIRRGGAGIADRLAVVRALRRRRFDLAVLMPKSFESALWVTLAGIPRRVGFVADLRGPMLTGRARLSPALLGLHQVNDYLAMVQQTLGIQGSADEFAPDIHPPHRLAMQEWLAARRKQPRAPLIALAAAAAYGPAKEWPAERYAALIDVLAAKSGAECVLLGAPGERAGSEKIAQMSTHGAIIAAGETSVGQAIALLSLCQGFAGNDSGSMHVAGALGIPTVGIFGSTNPRRTAPLGARARTIYKPIECSPCLARTCRYAHYRCLWQIEPEEVASALRDLGAV